MAMGVRGGGGEKIGLVVLRHCLEASSASALSATEVTLEDIFLLNQLLRER